MKRLNISFGVLILGILFIVGGVMLNQYVSNQWRNLFEGNIEDFNPFTDFQRMQELRYLSYGLIGVGAILVIKELIGACS